MLAPIRRRARRIIGLTLLIGTFVASVTSNVEGQGQAFEATYDTFSKTTTFSPPAACDKIVSVVSTAGNALTGTVPGEAGKFHYFCEIRVVEYAAAGLPGAAVPITVTTTNLPGNFQMTFATGLVIGTFDIRTFTFRLKSSVIATDTTVVAPASPNVIWRINLFYATAP